MKKRILACLLAAVMALQVSGLPVFAEQEPLVPDQIAVTEENTTEANPADESDDEENNAEDNPAEDTGESVFNFTAAKYVMSEADESYEIKVERIGNADAAADVVFKAVDVFAVYGEDYSILDENGTVLEKTAGTVIAPDELTRLASTQVEEKTDDLEKAEKPVQSKTDIFEARNALLGIDAKNQNEQEQVKDEITAAVETVNNDLFDAEGVSGVLHFAEGETEKTITVVPVNNDQGETDKTVLMALLGASSGGVAPNATTTLIIMDDEEYIPPVFEMAQDEMTLDVKNPTAELTVTRVSGADYYSTVFVSTYSRTAKSGDDFTAIENQQVVFAPDEMEKTFKVEALAFEQSGDFGVRIKSDGSCKIGENDRTIVHINGEKSETENKTVKASRMRLQTASENTTSVMAVSEDGVVGSPDYLVPKTGTIARVTDSIHGGLSYRKIGEVTYMNCSYDRNRYATIDTSRYARSDSITITFTVDGYCSGYSYSGYEFIVYHGLFDSSKAMGYATDKERQRIKFKNGTIEVTMDKTYRPGQSIYDDKYTTIVFPYGFYGRFTINEIKLHYNKTKKVRVGDVQTIATQPIIDLDHDVKADQLVNYQPPKPVIKTENDVEVKEVYPGDGVIRIITDEDELMKHGVVLSNYDYGRLYGDRRVDTYHLYEHGLYVGTVAPKVNVHLQSADNGDTYIHTKNDAYQKPFKTTTGTILRGSGYAAAGKVITGYNIYAGKVNGKGEISETKYIYTYKNPKDASLLGGASQEEWFHVPAIQEDGWTEIVIVPKTEIQNLVIKPHPSTENETIYEDVYDDNGNVIGQREVTYEGRVYLNRTFDANAGEDDTYVADNDGQVCFERINNGSVFTLRSISPMGYLTEWVNGTMDKDGDGVIDNDQAGDMTQGVADELYVPVYGNQFVYQANQSSPQYYYRFTKFDPSRLLNGKTRVGYVKKDKRTIWEYNGKEASYKDYVPCPGTTVQIGENTAVTDSTGRFDIPMDGVLDAVRVSAAVTTDSGNFITHVQSNVENNIFIPFYDTFEPQKVTAAYENETAVSAPGIKVADKGLKVTVKVMHSANGMYIKKAGFYITDSSGKKVVDCNMRAEEKDSNYKISYTNDGTFGYAELRMNPGEDMLSGYKIYVYFVNQNGTEHRALDTGHKFIELLDLGTFALGAIGSSSVADATTEVVDLLGAPLFDFDMGQIDGFTTTTGLIEPDAQLLDTDGNKTYEYDATLYSYRYKADGFGNWSGGNGDDKEEGGKPGEDTGGDSGDDDADTSNFQAQHGEILNKMKQVSSFDPDEVEAEEKPKGADMNNGKEGVTKNSEYNFELTPSIRFDLITTARPAGKDTDGNDIYKHYFEEMSLGVGLELDVNSRTEISFPIGISVMIKPSLKGSIEAVYYMKTDYGDDKYWTERPIEYSAESFGIFDDYSDNMYRAGYILLNPKITIDVGVKVAIVEVDVGATFDFDMDFKFDSNGDTRTYGNMEYDVHINLIVLKMTVYSKKLVDGELHLFGEDEPIGDSGITLMSSRMSRAIADAIEGGDTTVKPADRSYLEDRSAWKGRTPESKPFLARLFGADKPLDEDNPADLLLQKGVMTGDVMDSAMLDMNVMFTAYVDDDPSRGANDRSCVYYTYTNDDGSWTEPIAIEDDGTLDKDPVVYDMGDKLFVAWLTANEKFDGAENSLETVRRQLNSLNIHAAFFDKATKTFGKIFEVTKTTESDWAADGNIAVMSTGGDDLRVYYTKTQYLENPENVNELIATSSVIAYRDYENGAWNEAYTEEETEKIENAGWDIDKYKADWYGQKFEDTQIGGRWPIVTDFEADIASDGAWKYFAFVVDEDGSYATSSDRKIYFNFDAYDAPVCITPEEGAYDDLQFVYSGEELLMTFKSTQDIEGADGEIISTGGISYINLSEVFEKNNYRAVQQPDGTYQMELVLEETMSDGNPIYYTPEPAVTMNGVVQKYEVFADRGGRIYLMWTDNTINDDGTSGIQIYASIYNGNAEWVEGIDQTSGYYGVRWSHPVMLTSPMQGSYDTFTAQSITGDGIAFVAKRTNLSDETEMVFHLRAPHAVFAFNEDLLSTKYAYIGVPVTIQAEITNVGLKAQKSITETENEQNTWVALPGVYQIKIERLLDGNAVETLSESEVDTIWNVGDTIYANYEWTPQELPDNMDLRVSVTDKETGEEICSEVVPVEKAVEIELGQVDAVSEEKNEAVVSFDVVNKGNIPANLTALISILIGEGEKAEISRTEIGEVAAAESKSQQIYVPIDEMYQTIDAEGGNGSFRLQIDIVNGDETMYSTTTSSAVLYSPEAIADVKEIESLSVEQTSVSLKNGEKAKINASLAPASAAENNKVIYVSSDENVAVVKHDGEITATGRGSATITAYAVSKMEFPSVQPDGSTRLLDVKDFIPDSMVKSQEIEVNVSGGSAGGVGGGGTSSYTITFDSMGGSKIDSIRVSRNGTVKEPASPTREGYTFGGWHTDKECTQAYDFSAKVTQSFSLYAKWTERTTEPSGWRNPFADVKNTDWFYSDVQYAHENNLFAGISDTEFGPNNPMTRAMLVTVLYRAEGGPSLEDEILGYPFADVDAESWYSDAVYWARLHGIVKGYSDEEFVPDQEISREQIAAIMERYADFKGIATDEKGDLSQFVDVSQISDWAKGNVQWAVGASLISGRDDGTVDPLGTAVRAEVAAILHRFMEANK